MCDLIILKVGVLIDNCEGQGWGAGDPGAGHFRWNRSCFLNLAGAGAGG